MKIYANSPSVPIANLQMSYERLNPWDLLLFYGCICVMAFLKIADASQRNLC